MGVFLNLAYLFFMGACSGWVLELLFRRFFSKNNPERKWINPGFLVGPWLPLYGFGLCILYHLAELEPHLTFGTRNGKIVLFLIMGASMTAIEYVAGLISTRILKVHLWDYSDEWGNLDGIICPRFSLFWTILGGLYCVFLHPSVQSVLRWLNLNPHFSLLLGFFLGIFAVDVVFSCRILSRLRRFADENEIVVKYDRFKLLVTDTLEARKQRRHFFLALRPELVTKEHMRSYLDFLKGQIEITKDVLAQSMRK